MNMEINPSEYKVLIVDDVISNVLLLKVLLTNEKFNIVTAGNGTQALEQVKKEKPDLVLLDVMMPDISGFEVAQQMKADPEMSEIPIIFLTALNSTADIVKGFALPCCNSNVPEGIIHTHRKILQELSARCRNIFSRLCPCLYIKV